MVSSDTQYRVPYFQTLIVILRWLTLGQIEKGLIPQFNRLGVRSIINLQMPGEHASCGPRQGTALLLLSEFLAGNTKF